ncbi:exported protein of unknown function [Nitrososphaera viennensis EN76]|uniref:Uncharacterized protein n=2 Tax=Nitrososphaera viennensis TaxID=1034015 RepID=A0A060HJ34_9ARCH|nr:exported protein of unknown function [Nitrososphaera viennensis EN76]
MLASAIVLSGLIAMGMVLASAQSNPNSTAMTNDTTTIENSSLAPRKVPQSEWMTDEYLQSVLPDRISSMDL